MKYIGLTEWHKGWHSRLIDTCRSGQDAFIACLRQLGHHKLAEKAEADMAAGK